MLRVVRGSTSSAHCFHPLRTLEKLTSHVWLLLILFTMERASQGMSGAKNLCCFKQPQTLQALPS